MTAAAWVELLTVAAVCILMASTGLAIGLYVGERGRRLAAERTLLHGHPTELRASVRPAGPADPEHRLEQLGRREQLQFEAGTIDRGVKDVLAQAKKLGIPMSEHDARQQVVAMLNPDYQPDELPGPPR